MMRFVGVVASKGGLESGWLLYTVDSVEWGKSLNCVSPLVFGTVFRLDVVW